ncbi:MAG TPA: hypothetical protein VFQ51_06895, partial [Vicinamibacteria bacterium]|nr:hypothetical protein [Vicinamibacteria bacterium]
DPSVAMDRAPGIDTGFTPSYFAYSDPGAAQIWYGVAGQTPELAVDGQVAHSLSLAHFTDGTPYIVYRGPGDHIYTATRKPTGEWGNVQLTNNTSGTARWSVDAVISGNTVHITYWDATYTAVRYARWEAGAWTFETAKNLASGSVPPDFVSPAVAADTLGRAYIAFNGRDGLLHYLRRTAPGTWSEQTFTPPVPVSFDQDRGPVGFTVDPTRRAHFLYGTGNGSGVKSLRYVNKTILGGWQDSVMVSEANSLEGFRGIDMVKAGDRPNTQLLGTWSFDLVGVLGVGCGNCQ